METIPTTFDEFKAYVRGMFNRWYDEYERGFSEGTASYGWSYHESPCRFSYYAEAEDVNDGWFIAIGAFRGTHKKSIYTAWTSAKHKLQCAPVL